MKVRLQKFNESIKILEAKKPNPIKGSNEKAKVKEVIKSFKELIKAMDFAEEELMGSEYQMERGMIGEDGEILLAQIDAENWSPKVQAVFDEHFDEDVQDGDYEDAVLYMDMGKIVDALKKA